MANEIYHRSNWGNAVNDIAWGDTYEKFDATNEMFVRSDNYENSNETDKLMAAINPKPSILLTPTAYDNGSLHSVKPVKTFGSELVTNGGFDTDSDWTATNSTISISNGVCQVNPTATFGYLNSTSSFQTSVGKKYVYSFDCISRTGSGNLYLQIGTFQNGNNVTNQNIGDIEDNTSYNITFTATSTTSYLRIGFGGSGTSAAIDNVSVKEVIDADFDFTRGSSATRVNEQGLIEDVQILSGNLVLNSDFSEEGEELVVNPSWVVQSGSTWLASDDSVTCSGGSGDLYVNLSLDTSKTYLLSFDVTDYTSGQIRLASSKYTQGATTSPHIQGLGNFEIYIKSTSSFLYFFSNAFIGSIDNVSVKEVGQDWTFGTGWSMGDGVATCDGSSFGAMTSNSSNFNNRKLKVRFDVLNYVSGEIRVPPSYRQDGLDVRYSANGSYELVYNSINSAFALNTVNFIGSIDNVSVIEITDDTDLPRIDYTDGTGSLLLEPQSTNLLTYSEDFNLTSTPSSGTGSQNNATTTPSSLPSPDGGTSAFTFIYDGTFNASIKKSPTVAADQVVTMSIFIKKTVDTPTFSADDKIQIGIFNNVVSPISLNLGNALNAAPLGEWKRYSVSATGSSSGGTTIPNVRCDVAASIDVFGWQLETNSFATSYIPTNGTTVTRSADVAINSGSSDLINSTEGVLYAEISALGDTTDVRGITLSDGSGNNRVYIHFSSDTNIRGQIRVGASNQASINSTQTLTNLNKIALKYKANDFALWINGVEVGTDTSGNTYSSNTLTELSFDDGGGGNDFEGKVKSVAVFKEALNNDQLERLTSEGYETFNLLAQANNYTII